MLREGVADDLYIIILLQQIVNKKTTSKPLTSTPLQGHSACSLSAIVASVDRLIRPTTSNNPQDILPQLHLGLCTFDTNLDQFSQLMWSEVRNICHIHKRICCEHDL